jgi:hypothetical protein
MNASSPVNQIHCIPTLHGTCHHAVEEKRWSGTQPEVLTQDTVVMVRPAAFEIHANWFSRASVRIIHSGRKDKSRIEKSRDHEK